MPELKFAWPIETVNGMTEVFKNLNASDVIFILFCILNNVNVVFVDPNPAILAPIM